MRRRPPSPPRTDSLFPSTTLFRSLRLRKLATEGRYAEALDLYRWFTPVLHLDCHPKLVQYIKLAQAMCGYGTEDCRAPRLPLVGAERQDRKSTRLNSSH